MLHASESGTALPHRRGGGARARASAQAQKYGKDVSPFIQDGSFVWHDFTSFLAAYDFAADLFRTEEDYARLAEHYLTSLARDGAIYSEFFTSPDHAGKAGLSPKAYTDALGEGMVRAKAKTGIEGRMIVTGVRHFGVEAIEAGGALRGALRASAGHRLRRRRRRAASAISRTMCAPSRSRARPASASPSMPASSTGWESVAGRARPHPAVAHRPWRARHREPRPGPAHRRRGRRARMLPGLQHRAQGLRRAFADHPFPALQAAGCKVTLNSDDPPYFWTSLKREYDIAPEHFGMDDKPLTA